MAIQVPTSPNICLLRHSVVTGVEVTVGNCFPKVGEIFPRLWGISVLWLCEYTKSLLWYWYLILCQYNEYFTGWFMSEITKLCLNLSKFRLEYRTVDCFFPTWRILAICLWAQTWHNRLVFCFQFISFSSVSLTFDVHACSFCTLCMIQYIK